MSESESSPSVWPRSASPGTVFEGGPRSARRRHGSGVTVLAVILAVVLPVTMLLPACLWRNPDLAPVLEGEPILVGVPLPLSGSTAAFGEVKRNAYEMAVEEINAAGGIDGRPLRLVYRDTAGDADTAADAAEQLVTGDGVCVLAGAYSSTCGLAVGAVAQRHRIPYLVDSATADAITQQKWSYVFRLNPPASLVAQGLMSFLEEVVKPKKMAIIHEQSEYGSSVARAMRDWCRRKGVQVPLYLSYESGALDFTSLLAKVKGAKPDVVYMASYLVDACLLMRQARAQEVRPGLFAGAGAGFALAEFVAEAGPVAENVVTAAAWSPGTGYPGAVEFAETYRARYGLYPTYHAAESYACIHVLADALLRAASSDPERIRVALSDTELLTAFGPVRFESFDKYTNQNRMNTVVLQVIAGVHETIWPPEAASSDCVFPDPGPGDGAGQ